MNWEKKMTIQATIWGLLFLCVMGVGIYTGEELILIPFLLISIPWFISAEKQRKKEKAMEEARIEEQKNSIAVISNGYEYEKYVANRLKKYSGFSNVTVTPKSGDFGVDIIGERNGLKYAIQCKYYTKNVGVESVQQVLAGKEYYDCDGAIVITNSRFTKSAKEMAKKTGVELTENFI